MALTIGEKVHDPPHNQGTSWPSPEARNYRVIHKSRNPLLALSVGCFNIYWYDTCIVGKVQTIKQVSLILWKNLHFLLYNRHSNFFVHFRISSNMIISKYWSEQFIIFQKLLFRFDLCFLQIKLDILGTHSQSYIKIFKVLFKGILVWRGPNWPHTDWRGLKLGVPTSVIHNYHIWWPSNM